MYSPASFLHPDPAGGPLQIVHDFQFVALNLKSDLYTFPPEMSQEKRREHVKYRVDRLHDRGYAGIVISVDNKNYLEDEDALKLITYAVDRAAEHGMRVWLYDEQYYPTGAAGGLTLRNHPELEAMALACVEEDAHVTEAPVRIFSPLGHSGLKFAVAQGADGKRIDVSRWTDPAGNLCWDAPKGDWHIWCFFTRPLYEGTYLPMATRAARRYPSVADERAMARFLEVTYTPYEKAMGDRLGGKVEAIFTDEPHIMHYREYPKDRDPDKSRSNYPSVSMYDRPHIDMPIYPFIPWIYGLEKQFESRNGYPLGPSLPDLFGRDFENTRKLRRDFFGTVNALFDIAYSRQFINKLHSYPMQYSGHWYGEESFHMQPYLYGDLMHHVGQEDIPGSDLLHSAPEQVRHAIALKTVSSAAHQYGKKHCMIEASNMCDKDQSFSVERIELAMAMMYALGIDTITSYYGEELFDEAGYKRFTAYTARLSELMKDGRYAAQALLYHPYEELAAYSTVAKAEPAEQSMALERALHRLNGELLSRQIGFDFINQEMLLQCRFADGKILTPCGETPSILIFPPISFVEAPLARTIAQALKAGVRVLIDGPRRKIEGLDDLPQIEFIEESGLPASDDFVIEGEELLTCYHCAGEKQQVYLLVNTGDQEIRKTVSLPDQGEKLCWLDMDTGSAQTLEAGKEQGRVLANICLPPLTARALVQEKA